MFDKSCASGSSHHRYAELHAHSAYSFLDGASEPEDLASAAVELGLEALALTDHDGMPGIVKHAAAGRARGLPTVHGAELTLEDGSHLPVLARDPLGYRRLSAAISHHNLDTGHRAAPAHDLPELAAALRADAGASCSCLVLTGTANGPVRRALGAPQRPDTWDREAAGAVLGRLTDLFGPESLVVELALDGGPTDTALTDALEALAAAHRLPLLATGAVRCARPDDSRLADVLAATRLRTDLEGARGHLPAFGRWLRSPDDMARLHRRSPNTVDATAEVAQDLAFDLSLVVPDLPSPEVPEGFTSAAWLRELTRRGALERYGPPEEDREAWEVLAHELDVIDSLDMSGYFLIVRSIVDFCESSGILCQGRGSAANSAVCYALGITAVDAVRHKMLFERFLSPGRVGYPDIDLDIESCRREEVIQYVYSRYGRQCAAQVANVVAYRPRSAVRDAARALGHPPELQDAWAGEMDRWEGVRTDGAGSVSADHSPRPTQDPPEQVLRIAERLLRLPRHLGVHPGGMVLADRPVTEVCPVRWAAMEGRTVLQWDKDDCVAAGLVKFDLLGLGSLTALRLAFAGLDERGEQEPAARAGEDGAGSLRRAQVGKAWGLHTLPEEDPAVYRLLGAADTVGVFQVESRAQMATLPRLRPRVFYDIVVEVALIRPGPIQGDAVNPYIRRRLGREEIDYLHESLRPALSKTLGIPLFQEQLMQIAVDAAGFSATRADALRQAMSAKRSVERMEELHLELVEGMRVRGIEAATAEVIFDKLRAFADFGFPESHAFAFAHLVYASAWLKARRPEDFYAGLLAAQPMGFWSPQTIVSDARRHGVRILPADVNASYEEARVRTRQDEAECGGDRWRPLRPSPDALSPLDVHSELAVRLGLARIKGLGRGTATAIVSERLAHGPYSDIADLARRVRVRRRHLEVLAASGALAGLGVERREALWSAGALAEEHGRIHRLPLVDPVDGAGSEWRQPPLPGTAVGARVPRLAPMSDRERQTADLRLTGTSTQGSPVAFVRSELTGAGILTAADVARRGAGERVRVAGVVTHRQRPGTASGTVFLNIEDETGLLNVVCSQGMWRRYRSVGRRASALVVRGVVESADGVTTLLADHLEVLDGIETVGSRDWC